MQRKMNHHWDNFVNWVWAGGAWTMFGISMATTKDALQIVALLAAIVASIFASFASHATYKKATRKRIEPIDSP